MAASYSSNFVIIKFGGTSVSNIERWKNIYTIVQQRLSEGLRPIVVCSALSQASNQLETILSLASSNQHQSTLTDLITRYQQLAQDLAVDSAVLTQDIHQLHQLINDIVSMQAASPCVQAQVMAFGELMLTRLGVKFLEQAGLSTAWCDVRHWLTSEDYLVTETWRYLASCCAIDYDENFLLKCQAIPQKVLVTQGFIASNQHGETVLLGRGGSDVSAAYLAVKLAAVRCEIWTDVPGIYTANPQDIPSARHLCTLDYEEAQEIASMGATVLHPNAINPCRQANIPLHIRFTSDPNHQGTVISHDRDDNGLHIKSILTKKGILLISIETMQMWHQVGFLSDVFSCFKKRGLSIDLVSTSEASVTVSLDRFIAEKAPDAIYQVVEDLNQFACAELIGPCASVSVVGHHIRAILHQLGSVFEVFEAQQVYLLSQAANDLNLTFVVDEDQVLRLAKQLHFLLIDQHPCSPYLSQSWQEEFDPLSQPSILPWWQKKRDILLDLASSSSPMYLYDEVCLHKSAEKLLSCDAIDRIFYAIKANSNRSILTLFYSLGLSFECVSINEVEFIFSLFPSIEPDRILFTPNFAAQEEYQQACALGLHITIDSIYPLEHWPALFSGQSILIRIDPGYGTGHHKFVITGGNTSKFGIPIAQLDRVAQLAQQHRIKIKGLHIHSGSGILNSNNWRKTADILLSLLTRFPEVKQLNLGGGLGIVEQPGQQQPLDIAAFNASLQAVKANHLNLELWLEPGRFLVAEAGVILAKVTQLKIKEHTRFIGINTGMNSLIRPTLYGAYHEIVNLTRFYEPKKWIANIVGPICESGDTLGYARFLPETQEGDIFLIATAGAYGYVMGSHYNQREPAQEYFLHSLKP